MKPGQVVVPRMANGCCSGGSVEILMGSRASRGIHVGAAGRLLFARGGVRGRGEGRREGRAWRRSRADVDKGKMRGNNANPPWSSTRLSDLLKLNFCFWPTALAPTKVFFKKPDFEEARGTGRVAASLQKLSRSRLSDRASSKSKWCTSRGS